MVVLWRTLSCHARKGVQRTPNYAVRESARRWAARDSKEGRAITAGPTGREPQREPRRELRCRRMYSAFSTAANNKRIARAVTSARQVRNDVHPLMLGAPTLRRRAEAVKKVSDSRTPPRGFPEVAVLNAEPRTSVENAAPWFFSSIVWTTRPAPDRPPQRQCDAGRSSVIADSAAESLASGVVPAGKPLSFRI